MKYLLLFPLIISLQFCSKKEAVNVHLCNWPGCEYKGLKSLQGLYNPIDSIHFYNPALSYEDAELIALTKN